MPPAPFPIIAGEVEAGPAKKFPTLSAGDILALGITIHSYTVVPLFPYVGMTVKGFLRLETTNEAGEGNRAGPVSTPKVYVRRWHQR